MGRYFAPSTLPFWLSLAVALCAIAVSWGSTDTRLKVVEQDVVAIKTVGTIPTAKIETKLEALTEETREVKVEMQRLRQALEKR